MLNQRSGLRCRMSMTLIAEADKFAITSMTVLKIAIKKAIRKVIWIWSAVLIPMKRQILIAITIRPYTENIYDFLEGFFYQVLSSGVLFEMFETIDSII